MQNEAITSHHLQKYYWSIMLVTMQKVCCCNYTFTYCNILKLPEKMFIFIELCLLQWPHGH